MFNPCSSVAISVFVTFSRHDPICVWGDIGVQRLIPALRQARMPGLPLRDDLE